MANKALLDSWLASEVNHLIRQTSDHTSLLIKIQRTKEEDTRKKKKVFRMDAYLAKEPDFNIHFCHAWCELEGNWDEKSDGARELITQAQREKGNFKQ